MDVLFILGPAHGVSKLSHNHFNKWESDFIRMDWVLDTSECHEGPNSIAFLSNESSLLIFTAIEGDLALLPFSMFSQAY
jgi:hypothetical protein